MWGKARAQGASENAVSEYNVYQRELYLNQHLAWGNWEGAKARAYGGSCPTCPPLAPSICFSSELFTPITVTMTTIFVRRVSYCTVSLTCLIPFPIQILVIFGS